MKNLIALCASLAILLLSSCGAEEPDTVVGINKEELTVEDNIALAGIFHNELSNHPDKFPFLSKEDYPEAHSYLNQIKSSLLNTIYCENRNTYHWNINILHDDEMKTAFSAPGGQLYIYTGLLKFLDAENQLACILAHEIAYADNGAVGENLVDQFGGKVMGDILLGSSYSALEEMACSLKEMEMQPEQVYNADMYSIELVCDFAYEALGITSVIDKAISTGEDIFWLTARPSYSNRQEMISSTAANCGTEESTFINRYTNFKENLIP